jgi:hypothetical protein
MSHPAWTRSAALAVATIAAALTLAACGDDSDSDERRTLTFTGPAADVTVSDLGRKGADPGDLRSFSQEIFEEGSDEPAGRLDGTVALTDIEELNGTDVEYRAGQIQFTLADGNLVAAGNYIAEPDAAVPVEEGVVRPIVGGTGEYFGASGEVTTIPEGAEGFRYELEFELPDD